MPRATVDRTTHRVDLKSCPGGYVDLRQLSFGEMLSRRDRNLRYLQELRPNAKPTDVSKVQIDVLNQVSREFDFKNCIVDHNLENEDGQKLDFGNPMTLQALDPKIAAEIERAIDDLNQDDFDREVFTQPSEQPSMETSETSSNGMDSL